MARKCSGPTASIVESPTADSREYRPLTQFQRVNMFALSMPNSATTASGLAETATKCLDSADCSSARPDSNQARAEQALILDPGFAEASPHKMNKVSDGSRSLTFSEKSLPSMLVTNLKVIERSVQAFRASYAIIGPNA